MRSITELAEAEKINRSDLCRVLRLTLLAPKIVEAMPEEVTLLMGPFRWSGESKRPHSALDPPFSLNGRFYASGLDPALVYPFSANPQVPLEGAEWISAGRTVHQGIPDA